MNGCLQSFLQHQFEWRILCILYINSFTKSSVYVQWWGKIGECLSGQPIVCGLRNDGWEWMCLASSSFIKYYSLTSINMNMLLYYVTTYCECIPPYFQLLKNLLSFYKISGLSCHILVHDLRNDHCCNNNAIL